MTRKVLCSFCHRFIDLRTATGFSALHFACCFGHLEVVKVLLQAGASVSVRTTNYDTAGEIHCCPGSTPLHLATVMGNGNAVLMLLEGQVSTLTNPGPGIYAPSRK